MTDEEFEQLVVDGIDQIPERFLGLLHNVAIVIEDVPSSEQLKAQDLEDPYSLLGLYEGVPNTERGESYGVGGFVLPDKITVFRLPTIDLAEGDPQRIREIVRDTVWHEIAHYFGYDDDAIEMREEDGTNRTEGQKEAETEQERKRPEGDPGTHDVHDTRI